MPSLFYTVGTWRVARTAYLDQLQKLRVKHLIDVRGNPRAGRQEELKRSRDFELALNAVGISYEYWGRSLGEDAIESSKQLNAAVDALIDMANKGIVCLLGHLHEPQGCHRLHICDLIAAKSKLEIRHLLWKDHKEVEQLSHKHVAENAASVLRFFNDHKTRAEASRASRKVEDPRASLPTIEWKDFKAAHFSDGKAYRLVLPFDTELFWYPKWLSSDEADRLEETVKTNVTFLHPTYMFQEPNGGFTSTLIKRGQMRICDIEECPGAVASAPLQPWSRSLLRSVEDAAGDALNCFVANHYANGRVVINWHSDSGPGDDEGLGPNPCIGSVSLGAERVFSLKSKRSFNGSIVHLDIPLTHGSLLVMGKNSQTHWLHALLPDDNCRDERINLTFRFYARESTKHIEGMEHNHEWEAAPGSTRVKLHRGRFGRPVFVDVPDDLVVKHVSKYMSSVLNGYRGSLAVSIQNHTGEWIPLAEDDCVVGACKRFSKSGNIPDVQVAQGEVRREQSHASQCPGSTSVGNQRRWQRSQGRGKGKGRGGRVSGA
eukprot:TRINITY_DN17934_c0_g2_i1.p1 TRINITY_DN17934_c0_g2~~TRINITY_DN17934_c0_g2_i1.p1  ORF type:complete len:545 (+),score=48.21 TRINITY_DN17934_c0_g2_i1:63-1697(+)